jgi:hypothetical protein
MIETPAFKLWLALETGRAMVKQSELDQIHVPDSDLKIEVRQGGRWVEAPPHLRW